MRSMHRGSPSVTRSPLMLSAIVVVSLLFTVAPVRGAGPAPLSIGHETSDLAQARWAECVVDSPEEGQQTCTSIEVHGVDGVRWYSDGGLPMRESQDLACVYMSTDVLSLSGESVPVNLQYRSGCAEDATFHISRTLDAASLSATIGLFEEVCVPNRDGVIECTSVDLDLAVGVTVEWTGNGDVVRFGSTEIFNQVMTSGERCVSVSGERGKQRAASASGTLDGTPLGLSDEGVLGRYVVRSLIHDTCEGNNEG